MAGIDLKTLELGEVAITPKGKSVPITANKGPVTFTPNAPLQVVYEPSGFNDPQAERVNLVMRPTPELLRELYALDAYVVSLMALDSVRIFGKALTEEEVKARYSPIVKESEKGYPQTFRAKINLGKGPRATRLWDAADKRPISAPEAWTRCEVRPMVTLKGLWMMSKEVGVLLEASDIQIANLGAECPF